LSYLPETQNGKSGKSANRLEIAWKQAGKSGKPGSSLETGWIKPVKQPGNNQKTVRQ